MTGHTNGPGGSGPHDGWYSKRKLTAVLVVLVALLVVAGTPAAASHPTGTLSYTGNDPAPDPYIDVDTQTSASVPMAEISGDDVSYFNDQGEWVDDPRFVVNRTEDIETGSNVNPYQFIVTDIEDDSFGAFPRVGNSEDDEDTDDPASVDNLASALDAGEWTEETGASNVTVTDTTTAQNVEAVRIDTGTNGGAGTVAEVAYGNWSDELDSDEEKRFLQLAVDVDTLDANTEVAIEVEDETGDTKTVYINSSKNYADDDVLANGTGEGYVTQVQLNDLSGTALDNLESINVTVTGGDFDGSFAWIDLEKKGYTVLGEEQHDDSDSDDDWDDTKEHNTSVQGHLSLHDLTTLDPEFDDATIHDLDYPAKWRAQDLHTEGEEEEWVAHTDSAANYPSFDQVANVSYRLELPAHIDLSYSGTDLMLDQMHPSGRYIEFGYEEGAGDDKFADATLTDKTGDLGSVSDDVADDIQVDGSISTDTEYVLHFELTLTQSEYDTMFSGGASSDGGGNAGGGGAVALPDAGGVMDFLFTIPGMIVAGVVTWFGGVKFLIPRVRGRLGV